MMDNSVLSDDSLEQSGKKRNRDKKISCSEILKQYDLDVSKQKLDKFSRLLRDICDVMGIDDDVNYNTIGTLRKIETSLNYFTEARNHLHEKSRRLGGPDTVGPKDSTITKFELQIDKERKEKARIQFQEEIKARNLEAKQKQLEKTMKLMNSELFRGKPGYQRSKKVEKKIKKVVLDNLDQDTKDEKQYLGEQLFDKLQEVKELLENEEVEEQE